MGIIGYQQGHTNTPETDNPGIPDGPGKQRDPKTYGGYNGYVDENGNPVDRTGASDAVGRYQAMGADAQKRAGVQVGNMDTLNSRNDQYGASTMLQQAAAGWAPSQAEKLRQNMIDQSINAQASAANSVRGGPAMQGAAARHAAFQGAAIQQQGANDIAALRAKEMAEARGQYFGATTAIRGQDITLAQAQAEQEARQRALNDAAQAQYESLAHDVNKTQLNANLGFATESDAAWARGRQLKLQQEQQDYDQDTGIVGAVLGGVGGVSDARAKQDIHPLMYSDERVKKSERLKGQAEGAGAVLRKMYDGAGQQTQQGNGPSYANGIYRDLPDDSAQDSAPIGTDALHRQIERDTAGAQPYGSIQAPAVTGSATPIGVAGAPQGYSASRRGQQGDMFGGGQQRTDLGAYTAMQDEALGLAPGTTDYNRAMRSDVRSKEGVLMLSDDRAKLAAAWDQGHAAAIANVEKMSRLPAAELKQRSELRPGQTADDEGTAAASTARNLKMSAWDEGNAEGKRAGAREKQEALSAAIDRQARIDAHQLQPTTSASRVAAAARKLQSQAPVEEPQQTAMTSDERAKVGRKDIKKMSLDELAAWADNTLAEKRAEHERAMAQPAAVDRSSSGLMGRANRELENLRAEDARRDAQPAAVHDPMADANRSMVPSAYSYKPGFESPGQAPGETNVGPMAQNMAADPVARNAVKQDPETGLLALDKEKSLKLVMGSAASLQQQNDEQEARLRALEAKRGQGAYPGGSR